MNEQENNKVGLFFEGNPLPEIIDKVVTGVLDGTLDAALVGVSLKKMTKLAEIVLADDRVKQSIQDATMKYIEKGSTGQIGDTKIQFCPTYTAYDFKVCGDPIWDALDDISSKVKEMKKNREDELKLLIRKENELSVMNREVIIGQVPKLVMTTSGEIIELSPPLKYQTEGIKYTIKTK